MADIILILVLAAIVGAAILYIRKEKKKGVTCIGCPYAATCGKNGGCSGTEQKKLCDADRKA